MDIKNVTKYIVRTDTLDSFLNDIKGIKPMSAEEEKEAFNKYNELTDGDEKIALRNEIIMRNIWFVYAVAKRYDANENEDSKVLEYVNLGVIGMIEAFENYDVNSGNRFCTFSVWYIRRAINGYINNEEMFIVPTNHTRISPKVKKLEEEFIRKNDGRKPTVDELKDMLFNEYNINVSDKSDLYGVTIEYIDTSVNPDDDDYTVADTSNFNEYTSIENEYVEKEEKESLSYEMKAAMNVLDEREKKIINMHCGIGYIKSYKDNEIADIIGLTSERVRQIRHKAIGKLRDEYVRVSK